MRKNPPRTKMESKAPKVQSRYLNGPSVSCHDHCKCAPKEPTEPKPTHSFLRRSPKPPPNKTKPDASKSKNGIKKAPSVVPKITTRNVKNNSVVKDPISSTKKGVSVEPKSRDLKPKSENSQAKKYNSPNSRTSRRHSDIVLPNEDMPLPSSRVPKRRLSEIGIYPKKDVVSVSNTSLVRGSRINKNEARKDPKLPLAIKRSNSIKPIVSSPKRDAKVSTLRSYKSLPQPELKTPRKSKPKKPIEEVVPEKTLHVEPNNGDETENSITLDSPSSSEEKVMTHDHNKLQESSPPMEDNTTTIEGQHDESVVDLEVIDTITESYIIPDTSPSSEENIMTQSSPSMEDDTTTREGQHDESVVDLEVIDTITESHITPDSSPSSEENIFTQSSPSMEDDTTTEDGQHDDSVADSEVIDAKEEIGVEKLVVETTDCSLDDFVFRKGKFLSPHSEGSSPRKKQFMEGKELDEKETEKGEKIILRRMSFDGVIIHVPETQPVSVDLKHQEMAEKESPTLFNKVLEETANKLIQTRKSKVKALVGAFENIVSATTQLPDTLETQLSDTLETQLPDTLED